MSAISICPRSRVSHRTGNGVPHIAICLRADEEERIVSTGLVGSKDDMKTVCRPEVVRAIKIVYCIIDALHKSGQHFTIDDVINRFLEQNRCLNTKYDGIIRSLGNNFPIDSSIAKISAPFRKEFKIIYEKEDATDTSILNYFYARISELQDTGYLSTSRSYRSVMISLEEFMRGNRKSLQDIDADFILEYDAFLKQRDLVPDTIGFYMRTLRTALKTANERGLCQIDMKWFDAVNTSVGSRTKKMASKVLNRDILRKLQGLELDDRLSLARDLFMFAFYCRGMELIDVLTLKPANVIGQYLVYNRRQKGVQKRVRLEPEAIKIIEKYHREGSVYLFPPLEGKDLTYFPIARGAIAVSLKNIGRMIGCTHTLSFSYNSSTWQAIADESCLSSKLVG